jgi:hypothetical protein
MLYTSLLKATKQNYNRRKLPKLTLNKQSKQNKFSVQIHVVRNNKLKKNGPNFQAEKGSCINGEWSHVTVLRLWTQTDSCFCYRRFESLELEDISANMKQS